MPTARPADPLSAFRLDDKVAVVTGASSGLGDRFARVLHAAGARVVVAARCQERLDALAAALPGAVAVAADLAEEAGREQMMAEVLERCGTIDVLVNNAGVGHTMAIEDEDVDTFRRAMEVNVTAVWHSASWPGSRWSPTAPAASSTSPRCSASSDRLLSSRRTTWPARVPS